MEQLLRVNPGLASRFTTRVHFPSYASSDLLSIARAIASADRNVFDETAMFALESIMSRVCDEQKIDELGNARFVRNLYEKAIAHRDLRLAESGEQLTIPAITTIAAHDLNSAFDVLVSCTGRKTELCFGGLALRTEGARGKGFDGALWTRQNLSVRPASDLLPGRVAE